MPLSEIVGYLPPPGTPLLIAVSGGCDSMVLLDVLRCADQWPLQVFHLDHQLRADSDQDAALVQNYCEQHHIPYQLEHCDVAKKAEEAGVGIEEAARNERYQRLSAYAQEYEIEYIVTAHHQDDQIETILMNQQRGADVLGNAGMSVERALGSLILLRPCLQISRDEIRAYATDNSVPFREDSSNSDTRYRRNYLRHEIIPALEREDPNWKLNLLSEAAKARQQIEQWDSEINLSWQDIINTSSVSLLQLGKWSKELRQYFWRRLLTALQLPVSRQHIERCEDLAAGANSRRLQLGNMQLIKNPDAIAWLLVESASFEPMTLGDNVRVGDHHFSITEQIIEDPVLLPSNQAAINPQCVQGQLVLRRIESGEQWQALGAPGHKSVMSYLSDKKCPVQKREQMIVVADEEGVLWIPGYTIAERARIQPGNLSYLIAREC